MLPRTNKNDAINEYSTISDEFVVDSLSIMPMNLLRISPDFKANGSVNKRASSNRLFTFCTLLMICDNVYFNME